MLSTTTFLGTASGGSDGPLKGSFLVDDLLEAEEHTIQLNGISAGLSVRSTSLGVRVDDSDAPSRERIVLTTASGGPTAHAVVASRLAAPWRCLQASEEQRRTLLEPDALTSRRRGRASWRR